MPQSLQNKIFVPSENCINLIKSFEGYAATARHDEADRPGIFTGGWGSIYNTDGTNIQDGETKTIDEWNHILSWEIGLKSTSVNAMLQNCKVYQSMFDALVSFAYNEGITALQTSSMLKHIKINPMNKEIYDYTFDEKTRMGVPNSCDFLDWTISDGKRETGLVRRRTAEAHLYVSGELNLFE